MHVMNLGTMFSIILDTEDDDYSDMLDELARTLDEANVTHFRVECEGVSWRKQRSTHMKGGTNGNTAKIQTAWNYDVGHGWGESM